MLKNGFSVLMLLAGLLLTESQYCHASRVSNGQQTGLLWMIEKAGSRPSYILGTIHSDDTRVVRPADIILRKLRGADSFTAELKLDRASQQEVSQLMFLPPGQKLESLIGVEKYQRCVSLLAEYNISENTVQRMKPWAVMVTLSMPKSRTGMVLDHRLYQEAEIAGKRTYGLETNREQVAVFESFSMRDQLLMLDDAIKEHRRLPALFDELIRYYLRGDLTGLQRISEKYLSQGNALIAKSVKQKILLDRNYLMVRRMKPRLAEGNSFIAVGALHLPGDEGILRLLEKQGYKISPVY